MQAGQLNRRVELQQAVETKNPTGQPISTWTTIVTRWAQIIPLRGQEKFDAAQMEVQTNVKIRIRYYPAIDATWRIKKGDTIYNIKSIINIGDRNYAQEIEVMEII